MVIRSALGAFGAVAVLGLAAAALPERNAAKSPEKKDPPFGLLAKADFVPPGHPGDPPGPPDAAERSRLLKLASFPLPNGKPVAPAAAPKPVVVASAAANTTATDAVAASVEAPRQSLSPSAPAVDQTPPPVMSFAKAEPVAAPRQVRAVVPVPLARSQARSGAVDINHASEDALDHLPGAGRIGHTIVRHRPYRTIQDLVHKRVLRLAAFQRIQSVIKVD